MTHEAIIALWKSEPGFENNRQALRGLRIIESMQKETELYKNFASSNISVKELGMRVDKLSEEQKLIIAENAQLKEKLGIAIKCLEGYATDTGILEIGKAAKEALEQLNKK